MAMKFKWCYLSSVCRLVRQPGKKKAPGAGKGCQQNKQRLKKWKNKSE